MKIRGLFGHGSLILNSLASSSNRVQSAPTRSFGCQSTNPAVAPQAMTQAFLRVPLHRTIYGKSERLLAKANINSSSGARLASLGESPFKPPHGNHQNACFRLVTVSSAVNGDWFAADCVINQRVLDVRNILATTANWRVVRRTLSDQSRPENRVRYASADDFGDFSL